MGGSNILDLIHERTNGRPYVLVVMAYKDARTKADKRTKVFELIRDVVREQFNFACLRADQVLGSGHELLGKIHLLIDRASLVVAEISEARPNVFYELGYAMGMKKIPILLLEADKKAPYDLQGLEVFEYENSLDGIDTFREKLTEHLRVRLKPELPLLRGMLGAPLPDPSYVVASPKYPGENSRIQGQVFDSRTFGDHVGILGLISAFGSMYGDAKGIELISAQHAPPDLLERDINLYLIGSRKVNPWNDMILQKIRTPKGPDWFFGPAEFWKHGENGDWPVCLFRIEGDRKVPLVGALRKLGGGEKAVIWESDYGIVVRAPHPSRAGRLVLSMSGGHSLGTAAACLAATRTSLIEQLRQRLPPGALEDKQQAFWALVKGTASEEDFLLDEDGVSIVDAGLY